MNVYVWYDIVSMFVNDVMCDRNIVSSGKEIPVLRLFGSALFGDSIYLRRYPNSTSILDSINEEYQLVKSRKRFIWPCLRF